MIKYLEKINDIRGDVWYFGHGSRLTNLTGNCLKVFADAFGYCSKDDVENSIEAKCSTIYFRNKEAGNENIEIIEVEV